MSRAQNTATKAPAATLSLPIVDAVYLARAGLAAASKDDVTPTITGTVLSATAGVVKVVSTDRYRVHRATVECEGAELAPHLMSRRALEWVVANSAFFGRPRQLLVEPVVTFNFYPDEVDPNNAYRNTDTFVSAGGSVTITIVQNGDDYPDALSLTTTLVKGNYPPIERLIDKAIAAPDVIENTPIDLDFLARARTLARRSDEKPFLRSVKATDNGNKSGQMLVLYPSGVCLVQRQTGR